MLYYAGRAGLMGSLHTDVDAMQCLAYGALISAVDPVATLSVLGSDEVRIADEPAAELLARD